MTVPIRSRRFLIHLASLIIALPLFWTVDARGDGTTPITPAEASKKINEKVVVEMDVKSTGGNKNHYLNSEEDYMDAKNFTIFIPKERLDKFKKAGIDNPMEHYKGKKIQVTGTVVLENERPWIKVQEPDQIKVVSKEKK